MIGFYRRSILTGWLFSIGVDRAVISEPLYNSLRRLAMLCGAILLIGSGLTFWVRKHLGLAFARLGALAASPEAATNRIASGITEVDFVGRALAEAFGKLQVQAEQLETAKAELENKVDQRTLQLSESAAELALSNARFEAAIANMTQGLCMLDAEQRVMVCNDRFRDLYKLSWEQSCPGTYLSGMLEHRRAAGTYSGPNNPDALKAMLQAGSDIRELRDGRTIRILRNPMSGGRIMTTHEDITDIKRAERDLDETKRFLDTIVENLPMAVLAKEAATGKFVLANRAYEDYIGVPREQFIGATVHELYAPEVANVLDGFDRDACALTTGAVVSEFLIPAPDGTERVATTTRMAVRNSKGEPSFLIVIIEEITKKRLAERRIAYLAHYDVLTGLANRATFIERLEEALEGNAAGDGFALHLIDLDHFKEINDSLGHAAGDELLFQIAHRLKTAIHPDDVCARLGGDEFAIIQRGGAADAAAALGERIVSALTSHEMPVLDRGERQCRYCAGAPAWHGRRHLDEARRLAMYAPRRWAAAARRFTRTISAKRPWHGAGTRPNCARQSPTANLSSTTSRSTTFVRARLARWRRWSAGCIRSTACAALTLSFRSPRKRV